MRARLLTALTALLLACAVGACGEGVVTRDPAPGPSFLATHRLDLLLGDCSSFRGNTEALVPDMVTVAERSAAERRVVWAACFDGAPLRTLHWKPKVDFDDLPPELRRLGKVADRVDLARAIGLGHRLRRMIETTPRRVRGSGQLEALEVAAKTAGVGRVFMFTDGIVHQVDGIRLKHATSAQIAATVTRWSPRLRRLREVQVMFVGVGRDTRNTAVVRRAEELFTQLAASVPISRFAWDLELPASFAPQPS